MLTCISLYSREGPGISSGQIMRDEEHDEGRDGRAFNALVVYAIRTM
jgi:hypothetical protein